MLGRPRLVPLMYLAFLLALSAAFVLPAIGGPTSFTSDNFNSRNLLRPLWSFTDPLGDASLKMKGYNSDSARVEITVPAGSTHDTYTQGYESPRIMQACSNTDFTIDVKYFGGMQGQSFVSYEAMGILVEQDSANVMRFDFVTGHLIDSVKAYSVYFQNGFSSPQVKIDNKFFAGYNSGPLWMRVSRKVNTWKMYYSLNGSTYTLADSFVYALTVSKVGLSVGNAGPNPSAFTTSVDYFFNADSVINPEDSSPKADVLSPLIYDTKYYISPNTLLVYWKTDEPADGRIDYGTTTGYGSQIGYTAFTYEHRVIISGFDPSTSYHFKIFGADAQANSGSSADYAFATTAFVDDKNMVSDDFNGASLNTGVWTAVNPMSDATFGVSGGKLSIGVPAAAHDLWSEGYNVPRVMQTVQNNADAFDFTVKFTSTFNGSGTNIPLQGIVAEQDSNNLLRANFSYDGTSLRLFVAGFLNGKSAPDILTNDVLVGSRSPIWLRVTQGGGRFRVWYSFDGNNFTFIPFFAYPLRVSKIGVFAGNVGSSPQPFTCQAEWVTTTLPGKPNLSLPLNNALDIPTPSTMVWDTTAGSTSYRLQVATDAGFGSPAYNDSTLTLTTKQVTGLLNTQKYYWRVRGKNTNGVGAYSDTYNFTTAIAAPAVPSPVQPADNAVDLDPALTIKWSKPATAATYRLQVCTDTSFTAGLVYNDSTLTDTAKTMTGLLNLTKYYWRVNAKNAGGTSVYSTLRNFTTISAVPVAPTLITPPNGSVNQQVTLNLRWYKSNFATTYRLQVGTDPSFAGGFVVNDSTLTDTVKSVAGLVNSTLYYWRVNAKNVAGTSTYSTVWSFTTIVANPNIPSLVSPLDGAVDQDLNVKFVWRKPAGATSYRLQVASDSTFATGVVVNDSTVTDSTKTAGTFVYNQKYFWRVNAKNIGGTGPYSTVWSFRTYDADPSIPRQIAPANNITGLDTAVTVIWTRPAGTTSFHLQVATDSNFVSGFVVNDATQSDTIRVVRGLNFLTKYYWRVNADAVGGTSPYSPRRAFSTGIPLPTVPVPVSPLVGFSTSADTVKLVWRKSGPLVDVYQADISIDSTFTVFVVSDNAITDTTKIFRSLIRGQYYFWRVRSHNAGGWSAFTPVVKISVTDVTAQVSLPTEFALSQNFPNPFNPSTQIELALPKESRVTLEIYNLLGQRVASLVNETMTAGYHLVTFDAAALPSGLYLYRMVAGEASFVKKMMLVK